MQLTGAAVPANDYVTGRHWASLAILTLVFFMWGFITVLNDIQVPFLQGLLADSYGLAISFAVPMHCYVYIAAFAAHCRRYPALESAR